MAMYEKDIEMGLSMEDVKPLRLPGYHERYDIARNWLQYYTSVGAATTYSAPATFFGQDEKGEETFQSIILTALSKTVQRHACLGVGIKGEETLTPEWIRLGSNKSRVRWGEVVQFLDTYGETEQWVEDALQLIFDRVEEIPVWRVRVTKRTPVQGDGRIRFKVAVFFHHAIGDGISGGAFHNAFRGALNAQLAGTIKMLGRTITTEDEIDFSPTLELLPNIEQAHPLPLTFSYMIKQLIEAFIYKKDDPTHWKGPLMPKSITGPPKTRLKAFSTDPDTTRRLVQRCRNEGVTITSLISYLIARKLIAMYPEHSRFSGLIPLSFRRFTDTSDDEMTLQVTTSPYFFTNNPDDNPRFLYTGATAAGSSNIDWQAIRALKTSINKNVKPTDSLVGMLRWAGNLHNYLSGHQGKKRAVSFELSNIGVVDGGCGNGKRDGEVVFERFMFACSIPSIAAPYDFCLASAKGGDMTLVVQWEEGVLSREEAEEMIGSLEADLRRLVDGKEE